MRQRYSWPPRAHAYCARRMSYCVLSKAHQRSAHLWERYLVECNCFCVCPTFSHSPLPERSHAMSHLYPKVSEHGLSSDDDEDSRGYGLFDERRLNNRPHRPSPSRNREKKWNAINSGSSSSGNKYSTQNSVSLADFDKEYIDDEEEEGSDGVRRRSYGGGGLSSRRGMSGNQASSVVEWLVMTSKWKVALIGLLLGLLCAVVYKTSVRLIFSDELSG